MSGAKIITACLLADAALLALLADGAAGVYPVEVPLDQPLSALAVRHISGVPRNTLSSREAAVRRTERIQVSVLAKSYVDQKALIRAVRTACEYQRGTVAGLPEVSVLPDIEGPDLLASAPTIYMQSHDFMVSFNEVR